MDKFTKAYIAAALWSSNDDNGDPLDSNYDVEDITPETLDKIKLDCKAFQNSMKKYLAKAGDVSQNGHDYWLTRNGHGVGFWDRGYPKKVSDALCKAARNDGEFGLYVVYGAPVFDDMIAGE